MAGVRSISIRGPGRAAARLARQLKGWCLRSNSSPDAPRTPATAPALRAALTGPVATAGPAAARIAAVAGAVAPVMWNMRKIHFSHSCKTAAARTAVKGAPFFGAFIGAKRRPFTDGAAEATRGASRAGTHIPDSILSFQHVHAAATPRYRSGNRAHAV